MSMCVCVCQMCLRTGFGGEATRFYVLNSGRNVHRMLNNRVCLVGVHVCVCVCVCVDR